MRVKARHSNTPPIVSDAGFNEMARDAVEYALAIG